MKNKTKYSVGDKVMTTDRWNNGQGLIIPAGSVVEITRGPYTYDSAEMYDCFYDGKTVIYEKDWLGEILHTADQASNESPAIKMTTNEVTELWQIPRYHETTTITPTIENIRDWLDKGNHPGRIILPNIHMDDESVVRIFTAYQTALEDNIERVIADKDGERPVPIGSTIKTRRGATCTITGCTRFEENTFGQGWYIYDTDNDMRLYRREFDVL